MLLRGENDDETKKEAQVPSFLAVWSVPCLQDTVPFRERQRFSYVELSPGPTYHPNNAFLGMDARVPIRNVDPASRALRHVGVGCVDVHTPTTHAALPPFAFWTQMDFKTRRAA
jgi:hypothetical protein